MNKYTNNSNVPSAKSIIYTVVGLLFFYNVIFWSNLRKKLPQSRYDWSSVQLKDSCQNIKVFKITKSNLSIKLPDICRLNAYNTYLLDNGNQYWFRYEYAIKKNDTFKLFDVHWLKGMPKKNGFYKLKTADLQLKNKGQIKAVILGDALVCRGDAEFLRQQLHKQLDWHFLGNQKDVLNYAYIGGTNMTSEDGIKLAGNIPKATYYVVGFNSDTLHLNDYFRNILIIKNKLKNKNAHKIFWIVPEREKPDLLKKIGDFYTQKIADDKNIILKVESVENKPYLNKNQYERLAKHIAQYVKD
ncbi:MAG TPA: hypothetical protein ENK64_02600 [Flavobacteriales bacterium]|nr:hypothetical protein [Flavobacteriales bacterium]